MKRTLSLIIIVCWLFAACQATPDKEVVVNKANGEFQEKVESTEISTSENKSTSEAVADSDRIWKTNFQKGKVYINIDADIEIPDVKAYPIIKIAQREFTQEDVDTFLDTFLQGEPLYEISNIKTKQEIENEIIYWKMLLQERKTSDPDLYEEYRKVYTETIENLKKELSSAPEIYERKLLNTNLNQNVNTFEEVNIIIPDNLSEAERKLAQEDADKMKAAMEATSLVQMQGEAFLNEGFPSILTIRNGTNAKLQFNNAKGSVAVEGIDIESCVPQGMNIGYDEAAQIAKDIAYKIGCCYMDIAWAEIGTKKYEVHDLEDKSNPPQCYVFYFRRFVNGIPETYEETISADTGGYAPAYFYENLRIDIDDSGILFLKLIAPTEYIETLNDNTEMLTFEEIQDVFRKNIEIKHIWNDDQKIDSREIHIQRITLGMIRIANQNDSDGFILVPAWDFFGYTVTVSDDDSESKDDYTTSSYLTINAIDGSIIDRSLGY